ncbi:MAG TPA: CoB--CoM heterodisulfide reductase iron-sulfur subunit B family protein [Anaerolineae bacterium]|nr:CoB--CoM heterodisulfide reductase iron-sulfur subunit B family protein [Anaerolineae bacterium]
MKYGFFPGCSYNSAAGYRQSVDAINRLMEIDLIEIPDWNCCGATAFFSLDEFKALALTARLFALAQASGFREIVTVCNACYTTLRKANQILSSNPETVSRINKELSKEGLLMEGNFTVRHYLEVLYNDVPAEKWSKNLTEKFKNYKVACYYGCQLTRPWGDLDHMEQPTILDRFIERLGFLPVDHSARTICCGASHTVSYADECGLLVSRIIREVHAKGGHMITTLCPLCQFNLDSWQKNLTHPIPVPFFTQLAGLALGLNPTELGLNKLLVPINKVLSREL